MAQVAFCVKYYFNSNGLDWDEIPEGDLEIIRKNCKEEIFLNFAQPKYPQNAEIQNVDNYSGVTAIAEKLGFDCFAEVYLTFDVEDFILEDLGVDILDESESYVGNIDSIFGANIFQVSRNILVEQPEEIWID